LALKKRHLQEMVDLEKEDQVLGHAPVKKGNAKNGIKQIVDG